MMSILTSLLATLLSFFPPNRINNNQSDLCIEKEEVRTITIEDAQECSTCLGKIEKKYQLEPCNHIVCQNCLKEEFEESGYPDTCPICKISTTNGECPICFYPMQNKYEIEPCTHTACLDCLYKEWEYRDTCPICRIITTNIVKPWRISDRSIHLAATFIAAVSIYKLIKSK